MKYFTYILFSEKNNNYYIGQTNHVENRLLRHNKGLQKYTKKGVPWNLIGFVEFDTRKEAMKLERKIKIKAT